MRACAHCEEIDATLQLYSNVRGFSVRLCANCAMLPVVNVLMQEIRVTGYSPATRIEMLPDGTLTNSVAANLIFWLFGPREECGDEGVVE